MSRLTIVQEKYPTIDWNLWKEADPSKNFKYLEWIGKHQASLASPESSKQLLTNFEKCLAKLKQRDIFKWEPTSLKTEIDALGPSIKEIKENGAILVGEIDGWKIHQIESLEACQKYAANTKWCITQEGHFTNYCSHSNIFIITKDDAKFCLIVNINKNNASVLQPKVAESHFQVFFENKYPYGPAIWDDEDRPMPLKPTLPKFIQSIASNASVDFTEHSKLCIEFTKKHQNIFYCFDQEYAEIVDKINWNGKNTDYKQLFILFETYLSINSTVVRSKINNYLDNNHLSKMIEFLLENDSYPLLSNLIQTDNKKNYYWRGYQNSLSNIYADVVANVEKRKNEEEKKQKKLEAEKLAKAKLSKELKEAAKADAAKTKLIQKQAQMLEAFNELLTDADFKKLINKKLKEKKVTKNGKQSSKT